MNERIRIEAKEAQQETLVPRMQNSDSLRSMNSPVHRIQYLQRTYGNQAVQRMLKSAALQAKLRIGQPGDIFEQEADRVAEQVASMPEPSCTGCAEKEREEELIQPNPISQQINPQIQRQVASTAAPTASAITNNFLSPDEADKVIKAGEKWIGTPYKYRGDSKEGIDCSHFVHRAYADAGFDYTYASTEIFPMTPNFVEQKGANAADVALFPGHMGIYNSNPPKKDWTILSARSVGVQYGKPEWYGTHRYFRYRKTPAKEMGEGIIQKKNIKSEVTGALSVVDDIHRHAIQGGGQPLPGSVRTFFESRLCHDFSEVRVHTDAKAAEAARAVNARAFTVGRDVVFGEGEYAPGTGKGQRLLGMS